MSKPVSKEETTTAAPAPAEREVVSARLHGPIFVIGAGNMGQDIHTSAFKGAGKIKKVTMSWGPTTLNLDVDGIKVGVPHANVQCVIFKS